MATLEQYITDLESMLSTVNLSGFFTPAMKIGWINQAGKRVYNFEKWPWLMHALKTQTELSEWYEQPARFKKGSIERITIGTGVEEKEYDIKSWNLYKDIRDNQGGQRASALLGSQFFIYPTPEIINEEIGIYGQLKWVTLTSPSDEAITNSEDYDEAIVKLAFASALKKERRFAEANSEVEEVIQEILPRLYQQETKQAPQGYIGTQTSTRWQ